MCMQLPANGDPTQIELNLKAVRESAEEFLAPQDGGGPELVLVSAKSQEDLLMHAHNLGLCAVEAQQVAGQELDKQEAILARQAELEAQLAAKSEVLDNLSELGQRLRESFGNLSASLSGIMVGRDVAIPWEDSLNEMHELLSNFDGLGESTLPLEPSAEETPDEEAVLDDPENDQIDPSSEDDTEDEEPEEERPVDVVNLVQEDSLDQQKREVLLSTIINLHDEIKLKPEDFEAWLIKHKDGELDLAKVSGRLCRLLGYDGATRDALLGYLLGGVPADRVPELPVGTLQNLQLAGQIAEHQLEQAEESEKEQFILSDLEGGVLDELLDWNMTRFIETHRSDLGANPRNKIMKEVLPNLFKKLGHGLSLALMSRSDQLSL